MKQLVFERLNKMEDLEQRKRLRDVLSGVFVGLAEHQQSVNKALEERIFGEVQDEEAAYDIHASICARDEVDPVHEYLFPMREEDLAPAAVDWMELRERLVQGVQTVIKTVYMECDHASFRKLLSGSNSYAGQLVTTEGTHDIAVRLRPSNVYTREIEQAYRLFQLNGIPWRTVNHPSVHKFFDIVLVHCDGMPSEAAQLEKFRLELGEAQYFMREDMVPLWNIEKLELKTIGFPMPAGDRVNYEHVLSLRKYGEGHGFLVSSEEEIHNIRRGQGEISVIAPKEKAGVWHVWKVTQPAGGATALLKQGVFTNRRKPGFIGKFAAQRAASIRTAGEISRIIHSFEAADGLRLERIDTDPQKTDDDAAYDMNPFLLDTLRKEAGKPVLRLVFKADTGTAHRYDSMSFIVSEIQRAFPEYRWVVSKDL
ncbi:normocyte-binding protein [Marinicrinis lubricantis]|uniref:Normocyte-binding protein n=1 Tax=Marinicrinis lubricantis TaxID=2086470 RepID=A0ABW1INC7_9BACL